MIEQDDRVLKELYPKTAKKILPFVEAECDRMEYRYSRMYDAYPDKYVLEKVSDRICMQIAAGDRKPAKEIFADDDIFATDNHEQADCGGKGDYLKDLVEVLLYHEIFVRRCAARYFRK